MCPDQPGRQLSAQDWFPGLNTLLEKKRYCNSYSTNLVPSPQLFLHLGEVVVIHVEGPKDSKPFSAGFPTRSWAHFFFLTSHILEDGQILFYFLLIQAAIATAPLPAHPEPTRLFLCIIPKDPAKSRAPCSKLLPVTQLESSSYERYTGYTADLNRFSILFPIFFPCFDFNKHSTALFK